MSGCPRSAASLQTYRASGTLDKVTGQRLYRVQEPAHGAGATPIWSTFPRVVAPPAQNRQVPVPKMAGASALSLPERCERRPRRHALASRAREVWEALMPLRAGRQTPPRPVPAREVRGIRSSNWGDRLRGSTFPRVSSRGCATESAARGPPAHVGVRSWRSYAATSWGGTVIIPHMAIPRNAPLTAKARDAPLAANGQYETGKVCGCRRSLPNPLRRSSALR
jgi:hypothetical protein